MVKEYELEVFQDGEWCAGVSGPNWERVYADALHYAMVYAQDGPTEIRGIPPEKAGWVKDYCGGRGQGAVKCRD